jgi:hypothetical protein
LEEDLVIVNTKKSVLLDEELKQEKINEHMLKPENKYKTFSLFIFKYIFTSSLIF